MKTIALCMIVRNEAPIILRCLESARPLVDYVLVEDTGSSDGTQELIRGYLRRAGLPGEVFEEEWQDFAFNRSIALAKLRENGAVDYALVLDADDQLVIEAGFDAAAFKESLSHDIYRVEIRHGSMRHGRDQICSNKREFRYRGVLHEYLEGPPGDLTKGTASGFYIAGGVEGARSRELDKYLKDARILEQALQTETDPFLRSRYTFYLAQSYRDAGDREKALETYLKRAELGFWAEEIFVSLYCAAQLLEAMGRPFDDVIAAYLRASDAAPGRAEALHAASRLCRTNNKFAAGYEYARRGLHIPPPAGGLFVEPWVYDYGLLDELSVHAYWIERYRECLDACGRLLREGKMPADMRARVRKNADFARQNILGPALLAPQAPGKEWAPTAPVGGTELMVAGLRDRLARELDHIDFRVNHPGYDAPGNRPRVVWMHHDVDQAYVQWCRDTALVETIRCFVFVSNWQRERYLAAFGLPPERCVVLRNATTMDPTFRFWEAGPPWRCAFVSAPFRGLSVLLEGWQRCNATIAELHIWSSMRLYLEDDGPYDALYERARSMRGVIYHGCVPNEELRAALRCMHFLVYPSVFAETSCLSAIEAMAAGCRVIGPSLGALPETACGYARLYPRIPDADAHAAELSSVLADELEKPWNGQSELSLAEQSHCAAVYDWDRRADEWRRLIASLVP